MSLTLIVQARRGVSLSVATVPQPFRRRTTAETVAVEIWCGYDGEDPAKAQLLGTVAPGGALVREWNPDRDRNLRLYQRRFTVDGVPDVAQLLDADSIALPIKRVTEAPVLNQRTDATFTAVELGIELSRFTRRLRVEVSQNADMSDAEITDTPVTDKLPNTSPITRAPSGSGTETIYVRASVSAGGAFSPASDILTVTFANNSGSGGSGGSGGFGPGTHVEIEHHQA